MRRLVFFLAGLIVLAMACQLFLPASKPDVEPASSPSAATEANPVPPTSSPSYALTPLMPTSIAPPPPASLPGTGFALQEERLVNGYAIRFWKKPEDPLGFQSVVLIEAAGQPAIRVDMASAINDLTGSDLNGDGYPDAVVETYSGGAHCCFGTQVFSLRPNGAALILKKPESNAGGAFQDLNADGISEFVTFDDSFAYRYCPYAAGVVVKAILAYDPAQDRYLPASPRFPEQYREEIAQNEERARMAPGEMGEWDGSNICAILPLALDYLYIGQPERAQSEFASRYSAPDAQAKWAEILQVVQPSPLYTP